MRNPTPKQTAFANAIVSGLNPSEAYRAAYDTGKMSATSVNREAQRLLKNPTITPLIEQGKREAQKRAAWSRAKAIERLQGVNDTAYSFMMEKRFTDRESTSAFFNSLDRLNALCGTDTLPESATVDRPIIARTETELEAVSVLQESGIITGPVVYFGVEAREFRPNFEYFTDSQAEDYLRLHPEFEPDYNAWKSERTKQHEQR